MELAENMVRIALLKNTTAPPHPPRELAKRHHSSHTSKGEGARARKKERIEMEAMRRSSLLDEEARKMRVANIETDIILDPTQPLLLCTSTHGKAIS